MNSLKYKIVTGNELWQVQKYNEAYDRYEPVNIDGVYNYPTYNEAFRAMEYFILIDENTKLKKRQAAIIIGGIAGIVVGNLISNWIW